MPKNKKSVAHNRMQASPNNRRISVRSELRKQPDVHRMAKAVIALAMAQAEKEAAEEAAMKSKSATPESGDE